MCFDGQNIMFNPELSRVCSLYTINTCIVYCLRSQFMSNRDLRSENRPQVVCSQKKKILYSAKVSLLGRGEECNLVRGVFETENSLLREEVLCLGGRVNFPLNAFFVSRGGWSSTLEFWALFSLVTPIILE